ncbi:MAG: YicC/YloC family endoribonuclease [Desulfomonilaceae bacterium]|nr:YicC/YloC family endoribonuclease [Desulfomonilaceae bacterium]
MQVDPGSHVNGSVKSMTGFGRGRHSAGDVEVTSEIRSVNHRFLDISLRIPKMYAGFEPRVRRLISEKIHRGKVDVLVTRVGGKSGLMDVTLDTGLATSYYACLSRMRESLGLEGTITVSDMLTLKEIVIPVEKEDAVEEEWPIIETSLNNALDAIDRMRSAEGAALWRNIEEMLAVIRQTAGEIAPLVGQVTVAAKERLERRVRDLTGGTGLDEDRLLQEVALIADRSDITEELIRLESHIGQFLSFGEQGSPLGRKLDFLLQELNREVNTVGSKSASTDIAGKVVTIKAELEKIREQTQNIE